MGDCLSVSSSSLCFMADLVLYASASVFWAELF